MPKAVLWIVVAIISVGMCIIVAFSVGAAGSTELSIGTFVTTTLTFVALVFYANDTNRLARIAQSKWEDEIILNAAYEMTVDGERSGAGVIHFRLLNPSRMIIRAKVWADFKVYGVSVDPGDPYNGTNTWVLYPQQMNQGWCTIRDLLAKQGNNIQQMTAEYSDQNRLVQFTCDLRIEFRDERNNIRKFPTRRHYFSFKDWNWVPDLSKKDDALWENG